MSLKDFIERENVYLQLFNNPQLPTNPALLTVEQKEKLANRLASALSPEALTCDGEVRGAQLQAKTRRLNKAKAELESLGLLHGVLNNY